MRLLSGWGRTNPTAATVVRPGGAGTLDALFTERGSGGVIPRGLGRSYGDAGQCAGGTVVDTSAFDSIGPVHADTGVVGVGAGVSIDTLIRRVLPEGWFVPVSPGTRQVTVGGAIAADVHGKNHHVDGSFCSWVPEMTVVTPSGTRRIGPDHAPGDEGGSSELFWATAGGMGLTGVVESATLRLIPVESDMMLVDTERFDDLDEVMAAMESTDALHRYSVAWVDGTGPPGRPGRRGHLGRSVLSRGDHAPRQALVQRPGGTGEELPVARLRVPRPAPRGLIGRRTVGAFNEMWFRRAPRRESGAIRSASSFFHPLDGVADWNLLYGRPGMVQYQFVVGDSHGELVRRALTLTAEAGTPSSLAVLKRFGPGNPGPLSFPMEGWTLAMDFPVGPERLPAVLDRIDEMVAGSGGRVYLAKDARLRPELFASMYPRAADMAAVRRRVDPEGVMRSDLSRRLGIDGGQVSSEQEPSNA